MSKVVWIQYPFLPDHSEMVYDSSEGEVWFGGDPPDGVTSVVLTQQSSAQTVASCERFRMLVLEPPCVVPFAHTKEWCRKFRKVYTFNRQMFGPNIVHYRTGIPPLWPELPKTINKTPWEDRVNGVVAVMGNKYPWRVEELQRMHALCQDCGMYLTVYGRPAFNGRDCQWWYRGELPAEKKLETLANYRYCYCPENSSINDYLTEKLPEAMAAGCLPIYYGADPASYPEIPWLWVDTTSVYDSTLKFNNRSEDHSLYLQTLEHYWEDIRHALSADRLYEMILRDS